MKEMTICDPETYYGADVQKFIESRRQDTDKQWIFDLIDNKVCVNETVYVENDDALLCKDIHPGNDLRYLLIFRDRKLKTIRDLNADHVEMLNRALQMVQCFLEEKDDKSDNRWYIFFHYMPSVFQLHAHVSTLRMNLDNNRKHPLHVVVRNLIRDPEHYEKAMFLTPLSRALKSLNVYKSIKA